MESFELDVIVTRGTSVESFHRVHAAAVDACDTLLGGSGDPQLLTFWRSCAKPLQIIPLLESGGFDAQGWGDAELVLACASHGGEPEHVAIVESMLRSLGLEEGDLACGPQEPLSPRGAKIARESGVRIKRTHNNCSGKHTAMLALARYNGWPIEGYERAEHPVQKAMLNQVALWTGVSPAEIDVAVDGCGASVFGLPLDKMARAYARLARASQRGEEIPARVIGAIVRNPFLIGGTDRFDSVLMEEADGRILSKVGAEGVHCAVVLDSAIGVAVKVEDGNPRAQYPAMIRVLQELDALPEKLPPRLAELLRKPIKNSRGDVVGETTVRAGAGRASMPTEAVAI